MTLNSDSKNADCIHPASVWDALQLLDPFSEMLAEQAAPLIGIAYPLNLNVAELGDSDFVPHISHGTGRTFLLGDVMTEAVAVGGTSFDALYLNTDGDPGYFARSLQVYGREAEPCKRCGHPVERQVINGRSHHFCAECQKLPD